MIAKEQNTNKFKVDYIDAINRFANTMQKFPVKKILYRYLFRGKGLEFDSFRDYSDDDDANLIDWKASLRANKLLARKYIEERDLKIYFLFDVSNGMLFGSNDKLKAEYSAEAILALAHLIMEAGDNVGLIMYNNDTVKFIPPNLGKKHFFLLTQALCNQENYGGPSSLEKPLDYILKTIHTDYTFFIIVSDFLRLTPPIEQKLLMLSSRFETISLIIRDPLDEEIPNFGFQMNINDPYSTRQLLLDSSLTMENYKKMVSLNKKKLAEIFLRTNIDYLNLNTSQDFSFKIATFLKGRSKEERV